MATDATSALAALTDASFANGAHRTNFVPALNNVAMAANETATNADTAATSAAAAAASLATAQAITGGAQGVGGDALDVPRNAELGSAAFVPATLLRGIFPVTVDATYQIVPMDWGRLLVCSSGPQTWTLPLMADCPNGWWIALRNRSTDTVTIPCGGSDTIDGGATSYILPPGAYVVIGKASSTTAEVMGSDGARWVRGVGGDMMDVPRNTELGSGVAISAVTLRGIFATTQNSNYQIVPMDWGKLLRVLTGTRTWTLPLMADCADGWWVLIKNRCGSDLTINVAGSDTIDSGASSYTLATGGSIRFCRVSSTQSETTT